MQKLAALLLLGCFFRTNAQKPVLDSTHLDTAKVLKSAIITGRKPPVERLLDKTVINLDQKPTTAGSTVLEAMQQLPGVQVTPDGQVSINGKSGVNVYIDGKPTYLSAADLASLLSGMSAASVQRIEIMTNPPAKYDAAGTAGIINIVKKKNRTPGFNGSINGSGILGHYGRYNGGITASYKNEHINLFFNNTYTFSKTLFGRQVTSDLLAPNGTLQTEQVSSNPATTWRRTDRPTLGIDWYVTPTSTLSLSSTAGIGSSNDQTISSLDIKDAHRLLVNHEDFTTTTGSHPYNYSTTFQWAKQLDSLGRAFTIDLDYSDFTNKPVQTNRGSLFDTAHRFVSESDALLLQQRGIHIYAAQADYTHPFRNGRWEAGLKSSYVRIKNDDSFYDESGGTNTLDTALSDYSVNTEQIDAAYVTLQRTYKNWEAEAGVRAENAKTIGRDAWKGDTLTQHYFQLFPTLFLSYRPDTRNTILFRFGRRTERPDYGEMIPFRRPLTPTLYFQGNPNLRPHLSWHGELGYSWKNAISLTIGADLDHDYLQTLPYVDPGDTTITRRPTNVQAHSWNLDLTYSKQLTKFWSTDNTLSLYRNGFSAGPGGAWSADPGMVSVYLSLSNSFRIDDRLSAEVTGEYNSERRLITSRFGPYSLVNIAVKRTIWKGRGTLSVNAHNIFQSEGHNVIDNYPGLHQYSNVFFYTRALSLNLLYRFGNGKLSRAAARSSSEEEQKRAGN